MSDHALQQDDKGKKKRLNKKIRIIITTAVNKVTRLITMHAIHRCCRPRFDLFTLSSLVSTRQTATTRGVDGFKVTARPRWRRREMNHLFTRRLFKAQRILFNTERGIDLGGRVTQRVSDTSVPIHLLHCALMPHPHPHLPSQALLALLAMKAKWRREDKPATCERTERLASRSKEPLPVCLFEVACVSFKQKDDAKDGLLATEGTLELFKHSHAY